MRRWPSAADRARASGCSTEGATFLRGPVNPSTNYECGMLIDGFDSSPMVMMTYNPRYYPALMEQAGLTKAKDLNAYVNTAAGDRDLEKIGRVADRKLAKSGVTVRPINMKDFNGEVERGSGKCTTRPGSATGDSCP